MYIKWYDIQPLWLRRKNRKVTKRPGTCSPLGFCAQCPRKKTSLWMMWTKLMGPPVTKGPEARDATAGHLDPVQRTRKEMKLFWDFSGLLGSSRWRSLGVRSEEEEEGRRWELHSEEQCGIKYAEHLRASCYSYPSWGKEFFELSGCTSVYVPLCSYTQPQGLGEHPGAPGHQWPVPSLPQLGNIFTIPAQQEIQKHRSLAIPLGTATKTPHASAGPPGMTREATYSMHTNHL